VRALAKVGSHSNPVSRKPAPAPELKATKPFHREENANAAARQLKQLLGGYGGDVSFSFAAHNAGRGAVLRNRGIARYAEMQNCARGVPRLYGATTVGSYSGPGSGGTGETAARRKRCFLHQQPGLMASKLCCLRSAEAGQRPARLAFIHERGPERSLTRAGQVLSG
jgi:hypothetical protein